MRIRFDHHSLAKFFNRLGFYAKGFTRLYTPSIFPRYRFKKQLEHLSASDMEYAKRRVDYYVKLPANAQVNEICNKSNPDIKSSSVGTYKFPWHEKHRFSAYFFDLLPLIKIGHPDKRFNYLFGDINYESETPTFVKTRPVCAQNATTNSVLVNLDSVRHFAFIKDTIAFDEKKPLLVFRNVVRNQPHRTAFLELYHNHPLCDAGQVNNDSYVTNPAFVKGYISIEQQLHYKFIATIEGHDVATNLKWVMSSNSIAVMPKPKIESWFMEGNLIGDYHYIEIKDDYSDLPEKLEYYINHPDEAKKIIEHAHEYVNQFLNPKRELLIGRMVAKKYFESVS